MLLTRKQLHEPMHSLILDRGCGDGFGHGKLDGHAPWMCHTCTALPQARYGGGVLIHWEDVGRRRAMRLLPRLRARGVPTFNDDMEATAAVVLAALLGAQALPGG